MAGSVNDVKVWVKMDAYVQGRESATQWLPSLGWNVSTGSNDRAVVVVVARID